MEMVQVEINKLSKLTEALTNLKSKDWGIKESILKGIISTLQGEIHLPLIKQPPLFTTKVMVQVETHTF